MAEDSTKKGRATRGRRDRNSDKGGGNALLRPFSGIIEYFREVKSEMDKVVWPSREDTIRLTRIVIAATIVSSLVLGGLSLLMSEMVAIGLDAPIVFVVLFAIFIGAAFWWMRRGSAKRSI